MKRLRVSIFGSLLLGAALAAPTSPLTPAQQAQVQRVGTGVRCPICRDVLPITESGNDISKQMLSQISDQVQAGQSDAQIYSYFRERYGNRVLLRPPDDSSGLLLWAIPGLALLLGAFGLGRYLRPRAAMAATVQTPIQTEPDADDPYLAEIRARVRRERGKL
ncbi:cytochrome c-type biogenesis protein CcmH [Deinococcus sp.]|uniref:cytochrome c-type biogenesis protein n=1 Tax=Deinococcus sp. TaxID=47478 RepID=UPI0025E4613C|nr:cytochrome c-type biogenesis protein CcmH [Deinococcus sp.]